MWFGTRCKSKRQEYLSLCISLSTVPCSAIVCNLGILLDHVFAMGLMFLAEAKLIVPVFFDHELSMRQ